MNDAEITLCSGESPSGPGLLTSLLIIVFVALLLLVSTVVFEAPIELAMFFALLSMMAIMALRGEGLDEIQRTVYDSMRSVLVMVLILLTVGMLISTWAQAGTIPLIIKLGIQTINPTWFYTTAIILCSITSLVSA